MTKQIKKLSCEEVPICKPMLDKKCFDKNLGRREKFEVLFGRLSIISAEKP